MKTETSRRHYTTIKEHAKNADFCARKAYENARTASQARAELDEETAQKAATAARIFADAAAQELQNAHDKLDESGHEDAETPEAEDARQDIKRAEIRAQDAHTYAQQAENHANEATTEKASLIAALVIRAEVFAEKAEHAAEEAQEAEYAALQRANSYPYAKTRGERDLHRADAAFFADQAKAAAKTARAAANIAEVSAEHVGTEAAAEYASRAREAVKRAEDLAQIAETVARSI